jgi:Uma2 family endonuclease
MVAQPHALTAEEFAALPRDGVRLELVRGELIAMPPAFADHGDVTGSLLAHLGYFVKTHHLGKIYGAETGFLLERQPDTVRAPDIAFIRAERVTPAASAPQWNPIVPDLVVEVASWGDRASEIAEKVRIWLEHGVRLVWVVFPPRQSVEISRADGSTDTLMSADTLSGEEVVPGFTLLVSEIFA